MVYSVSMCNASGFVGPVLDQTISSDPDPGAVDGRVAGLQIVN